MKLNIAILLTITLVSCNDVEFVGSGKSASGTKSGGGMSSDGLNGQNGSGNGDGSGNSRNIPDENTNIGVNGNPGSAIGDPSKCWFAVSGAHLGFRGHNNGGKSYYEYQPKFPKTTSGNPISHGETFDTVGGVYLNARELPFVYGVDEEIKKAVDNTFDSIVIAPGMSVEIRREANGANLGAVIHKGVGPYIANSITGDSLNDHPNLYKSAITEETAPAWMVNYMKELDYKLPRIDLHQAKWVKVSKIPDVPCE